MGLFSLFRRRKSRRPDTALRDAMARAREHTERAKGVPVRVQLLAQISEPEDWGRIRAYWTRRSGMTGSWPNRLGPRERVLNLWPIPADKVGALIGRGASPEKRQPSKLLSAPGIAVFDPTTRRVSSEGALATLIGNWLDDVRVHDDYPRGLELAPPLLEEWAPNGRIVSRRVVTFDLDWELPPPPDSVLWPHVP